MLYGVTPHLLFLLESDIIVAKCCVCSGVLSRTKKNPSAHSLVLVMGAVGGEERNV